MMTFTTFHKGGILITAYKLSPYWITDKDALYDQSEVFYFRRAFLLPGERFRLKVRVSADSRYKLYLNDQLVSLGPCKGNGWRTFYEEVDLSGYLRLGLNVLSAQVVHLVAADALAAEATKGPLSVCRSAQAAFLLEGGLVDEFGVLAEDISTGQGWQVCKEKGIKLMSGRHAWGVNMLEQVDMRRLKRDWKLRDSASDGWKEATALTAVHMDRDDISLYGELQPWRMSPSPLPPLYRTPRCFEAVVRATGEKEGTLLATEGASGGITIPAGGSCVVELDAKALVTGYLTLQLEGGKGGLVSLVCSECYEAADQQGVYHKKSRDDASGILRGDKDIFFLDGGPIDYETFWMRTFRFVRLHAEAGESPLVIRRLSYVQTGYPLAVDAVFESSDPDAKALWDISVRTLGNCMHETYEDCPYYEQLQYVMDSRLEMLYTYQLTSDDRLARRTLEDYHCSMTPGGLILSRAPGIAPQVIPGFSAQFVMMLHDHYQYFGDIALIRRYLPTVDAVLAWFDRHLAENGMLGPLGYWSFVDWVEGWDQSSVPPAARVGGLTVYSLMVAHALNLGAQLQRACGRHCAAQEYESKAEALLNAVLTHAFDKDRALFQDGPGVIQFSQHTQIWAVLAGAVKDSAALIRRTLSQPMAKTSYAMTFYLLRALDCAGLYALADDALRPWRELLSLKVTTWVEDPVTQRSDCHGWGSLPIYEFCARRLGVVPALPGYGRVLIRPFISGLAYACGSVATVRGIVHVHWRKQDGKFIISVTLPQGLGGTVELPDGTSHTVTGTAEFDCDLPSLDNRQQRSQA